MGKSKKVYKVAAESTFSKLEPILRKPQKSQGTIAMS